LSHLWLQQAVAYIEKACTCIFKYICTYIMYILKLFVYTFTAMVDPSPAFDCSNGPCCSHETRLRRVHIRWVWHTREMSNHRERADRFLQCSSRGKRNSVAVHILVEILASNCLYRRKQTSSLWDTKGTFGAEWKEVGMTDGLSRVRVPATTITRQRRLPPKSVMRKSEREKEVPLCSRAS